MMATPPRSQKGCGARCAATETFFTLRSALGLEQGFFLTGTSTTDARARLPKEGTSASTTTALAADAARKDASKRWHQERQSAKGRGRDSKRKQDVRRRCLSWPGETRVRSLARLWDAPMRPVTRSPKKSCWKRLICWPFGWETSWTCWNPTS